MSQVRDYQAVIQAIFRRMDEIAAQCGERFPLFRPSTSDQWILSKRGSWLGGFWAALWWRRAAYTQQTYDRDIAAAWTARLSPLLDEPSINRSFVYWYGAALSHQTLNQPAANAQLAKRAALAISTSFDPLLGGWTVGTGMGGGEPSKHILNVDALAPTLALLHDYGDAHARAQARQHLQTCLQLLATEQGAWRTNAYLKANNSATQDTPGAWPRGQAWAMLGLAEAVRIYGQAYWPPALQACAFWSKRWAQPNQSTQATAPHDLAAQVIAAHAMLKLSQYIPNQPWLYQQAHTQIASLLDNSHLTETGTFVGHLYRIGPDDEQWVESACASFFLLESLLGLLAPLNA